MNFAKVASTRVTSSCIADPYAVMIHYKRTFKFLRELKDNKGTVLFLGNKYQKGFEWTNKFATHGDTGFGQVDSIVISSAPKYYDAIMCMDLPLYAKYLRNIALPVVMVTTARELNDYPEGIDVIDYLLPAANGKTEAALMQLLRQEIFEAPATEVPRR
mmetsp:Transcript_15784/g.40127  ORF Transcript_15784/g.40127 Transcript_15784/m.40127 type:complete len:159 (+) Transcript_15784:49-525(+)